MVRLLRFCRVYPSIAEPVVVNPVESHIRDIWGLMLKPRKWEYPVQEKRGTTAAA
jgi:hypothetical protein